MKATELREKLQDIYDRHEVLVSSLTFVAGFLFDLITLGRIDDLLNLIQHSVYLTLLGTLLVVEIKVVLGRITLGPRGKKFWAYHDLVVHFLFGTLLSAYTIFFYTSASAITSFLFILLLAGLMLANEFPQIKRVGLPVRVILYNICLLSYFSFFYPILFGHVGAGPFWLGFLSSGTVIFLIWKLNFQKNHRLLTRHVLRPAIAVHLLFLFAYYFSLIPPVPVAVKKIGVYYDVLKENGNYEGSYLKPFWKFWSHGSQHFKKREGDKVYILLSIFSPARFEDKVFLKWYFDDPKQGWVLEDTVPLTILGGRSEGFRGFGFKQYFGAGDWKVIVETSDQRQVGRITFEVEDDASAEERVFERDVY